MKLKATQEPAVVPELKKYRNRARCMAIKITQDNIENLPGLDSRMYYAKNDSRHGEHISVETMWNSPTQAYIGDYLVKYTNTDYFTVDSHFEQSYEEETDET